MGLGCRVQGSGEIDVSHGNVAASRAPLLQVFFVSQLLVINLYKFEILMQIRMPVKMQIRLENLNFSAILFFVKCNDDTKNVKIRVKNIEAHPMRSHIGSFRVQGLGM
jgi:hypothetical protein